MMYRYQAAAVRREPERFWVRHPHLMGLLTFLAMVAAAVLLGGCECGSFWPCPK